MKRLFFLSILATGSWAATITSGTFTTIDGSDPSGNFNMGSLDLFVFGGSLSRLEFFFGTPQIDDHSGNFTFTQSFTGIAEHASADAVVGGTVYTAGPNTSVVLNLSFSAGPPLPIVLGPCVPKGDLCAVVTGVPFSVTGDITVVDNGLTIYSDTLTGFGTANGESRVGDPRGYFLGTYTFASVPEPATSLQLSAGLGALLLGIGLRRRFARIA